MLRLKREDNQLIFELKPPFDATFFGELKSTIRDFMKIGKKTFCYDFSKVEELTPEAASSFEDLVPFLRAGKCSLSIIHASDVIMNALKEHKLFLETSKFEINRHPIFFMEPLIDEKNNSAVISLSGEFIEQDALEEFKTITMGLLEKVDSIILDFRKLEHISTIAVGGLIYLKVQSDKENKDLLLVNLANTIKSTLDMSGILNIIPVFENIPKAKEHLQHI